MLQKKVLQTSVNSYHLVHHTIWKLKCSKYGTKVMIFCSCRVFNLCDARESNTGLNSYKACVLPLTSYPSTTSIIFQMRGSRHFTCI